MISAIGRRPVMAAPTANPTMPASAMGVSKTLSGPNALSRPSVTLKTPPASPTSSPIKMTVGSRCISSCSASLMASRIVPMRSRVDMFVYLRRIRIRSFLGKLNSFGDQLLYFIINRCQTSSVNQIFSLQLVTEAGNGVFLHPCLNLSLRAIAIGIALIAHVVTAPAIGMAFNEARSLTGTRLIYGPAGRFIDSENIIAIHTHCGNLHCFGPVRTVASGRSLGGSVFAIGVVLHHVNYGQLPQ